MIAENGGLTIVGMALVTGISCVFGMLSSASRVVEAKTPGAIRQLIMNAGATWIAAFSIGLLSHASLAGAALIGLGVGLAGTKVLEVIERGAIAMALRITGEKPVTHGELVEQLGEVRQHAQKAISEQALKVKEGTNQNGTDRPA